MDFPAIKERLDLYEKLMRLDKPIGILLLLWPTLWALWLSSGGRPAPMVVWIFIGAGWEEASDSPDGSG